MLGKLLVIAIVYSITCMYKVERWQHSVNFHNLVRIQCMIRQTYKHLCALSERFGIAKWKA